MNHNATVQDLLNQLHAGEIAFADVVAAFATRTWPAQTPATDSEAWGVTDVNAPDPNSWAVVDADSRLTVDQYQALAYAAYPRGMKTRKLNTIQANFLRAVAAGRAYRDDLGSRRSPLYATYIRSDTGARGARVREATVTAVMGRSGQPDLIQIGPRVCGRSAWKLTNAGQAWIDAHPQQEGTNR